MIRWLLYSPKRAAKTGLIAAGVLALAFACGTGSFLSRASDAAQPRSSSSNTSSTGSSSNIRSTAPGASPLIRDTAAKFTEAWLSADHDASSWGNRLRPYATKKLLDLTVLTDPAMVPTTTVKTVTVVTSTPTIGTAVVTLANGVSVVVTVVNQGGTWLADDLRPVGT